MNIRIILSCICLLGATSAAADEYIADLNDSLTVNSGFMSYAFQGAVSETGTETGINATNVAVEWAHFFKKDVAVNVGYRIARDVTERTRYQAGSAGLRVFPMTLGLPVRTFRSLSKVDYNFTFKPYVEGGMVMGRYLIRTQFESDVADISSEFWGINSGAGIQYSVLTNDAIDLRAVYELGFGYGPLDFKSQTMFVLLGWLRYL